MINYIWRGLTAGIIEHKCNVRSFYLNATYSAKYYEPELRHQVNWQFRSICLHRSLLSGKENESEPNPGSAELVEGDYSGLTSQTMFSICNNEGKDHNFEGMEIVEKEQRAGVRKHAIWIYIIVWSSLNYARQRE